MARLKFWEKGEIMFDALKAALTGIRTNNDKLTTKREKLLQRREDLLSMPISKEDFVTLIGEGIDKYSIDYLKRMQLMANDFTSRGNSYQNADHVKGLPFLSPWSGTANNIATPMAIFALLGTELKTALAKKVEDLDWPKAGPPIVERNKEIAKLDKEISKVEGDIEKLKTIARQSGIQLTGMVTAKKGDKILPGEVRPGKSINTGL